MHARFGHALIRGGISLPRTHPSTMARDAVWGKVIAPVCPNVASSVDLREAVFGRIGAMRHERAGAEGFSGIDSDVSGARAPTARQVPIDAHYRNLDLSVQVRPAIWACRHASCSGPSPRPAKRLPADCV